MTANDIVARPPPMEPLTLNSNGSFTYVPNSGFTGTDTFTYQATDGTLTSPVTTDTITVTAIVPAITAVADSYPTIAGQTLNVPVASGVLSNDTDSITGKTLTANVVSTTTHGSLVAEFQWFVYLYSDQQHFCRDRYVHLSRNRWHADIGTYDGNN